MANKTLLRKGRGSQQRSKTYHNGERADALLAIAIKFHSDQRFVPRRSHFPVTAVDSQEAGIVGIVLFVHQFGEGGRVHGLRLGDVPNRIRQLY